MVQLYVRDVVSTVTRPVKELKGFQQSPRRPAKHARRARDHAERLAFEDIDMAFRVEPGEFRSWLGPSSRNEISDDHAARGRAVTLSPGYCLPALRSITFSHWKKAKGEGRPG